MPKTNLPEVSNKMGKRIRKAIVAGFAAGVAGIGGVAVTDITSKEGVAKAAGMFIVAFVLGAYATWRTPNAVSPSEAMAAAKAAGVNTTSTERPGLAGY